MDAAGVEEMVVYFVEEGVGSVGRLECNHMEKGEETVPMNALEAYSRSGSNLYANCGCHCCYGGDVADQVAGDEDDGEDG